MSHIFLSLVNFLTIFDLFSVSPSSRLTFQNKQVYSSRTGKLMTIIVFICSIAAFIYFGLNLILRKSPGTIVAEKYQNTPEYLNLTKENFFLAFAMRNETDFIIDERFYRPQLTILSRHKSHPNKTNITEVVLGPCSDDDIPLNVNLNEYLKINPIANMYCVKEYYPLELIGSLDSEYYEYMLLNMNICNNKTMNFTCKSIDEINAFFNINYFYSTYSSHSVDSLNYETPLHQHGAFYASPTNEKQKPMINWVFQHLNVNTDDGIIFDDTHSQRALAKTEDKIFYVTRNENDSMLELHCNLNKIIKIYERKYDKLQEVLANTGGAIKILTIVALILTRPIIYFNFYRDLSNEYFDFDDKNEKNENLKEEKVIKKLKISSFEYFLSFFRLKNKDLQRRRRMWDRAKAILNVNLSLSQILKKFVELEKLKYLFFDQAQLTLFEFSSRPILTDSSEITEINEENKENNEVNKKRDNSRNNEENHNENNKEINHRNREETKEISDWNDNFFKNNGLKAFEEMKIALKTMKEKKNKNKLDHKMLRLLRLDPNYFTNQTLVSLGKKKSFDRDDEDFQRILPKSIEGERENENIPKELQTLIDTTSILKDLEMLKINKK